MTAEALDHVPYVESHEHLLALIGAVVRPLGDLRQDQVQQQVE